MGFVFGFEKVAAPFSGALGAKMRKPVAAMPSPASIPTGPSSSMPLTPQQEFGAPAPRATPMPNFASANPLPSAPAQASASAAPAQAAPAAGGSYKINKGDTLSQIAQRIAKQQGGGAKTQDIQKQLLAANPQLKGNADKIYAGKDLNLGNLTQPGAAPARAAKRAPAQEGSGLKPNLQASLNKIKEPAPTLSKEQLSNAKDAAGFRTGGTVTPVGGKPAPVGGAPAPTPGTKTPYQAPAGDKPMGSFGGGFLGLQSRSAINAGRAGTMYKSPDGTITSRMPQGYRGAPANAPGLAGQAIAGPGAAAPAPAVAQTPAPALKPNLQASLNKVNNPAPMAPKPPKPTPPPPLVPPKTT